MIKNLVCTNNEFEYMDRAQSIVEIYNQDAVMKETLELKYPQHTTIIYSDNDKGGLLLDYHHEYKAWRLMFAAFEKENRGRGLLTQCLKFAEKNKMDIAFVEVSLFSDNEVWKHLGYTIDGMINFCPFLANRDLK